MRNDPDGISSSSPPYGIVATVMSVCILYCIGSIIGYLLSISPGYASRLGPAAGFAVAAVLVAGARAIGGVWLGAFLFSLALDPSPGGAVLAACIASGASLQAAVAAWLTRGVVRRSTPLAREGDIIRFLCLGGPVACLVSATLGVAALFALDRIDEGAAPVQWLLWWSGDTLGVLLFVAPTLYLWSGRRRLLDVGQLGSLAFITGAALLASAIWVLDRFEEQEAQARLGEEVSTVAQEGFRDGAGHVEALSTLARFFTSSDAVRKDEFDDFTDHIVGRPGVLAVTWVPVVEGDERAALEADLRSEGVVDAQILDLAPDGSTRPAATRERYSVVRFRAPEDVGGPLRGIDLASEPSRRRAIEAARDTGSPAALVAEALASTGKRGVLVFVPVYGRGAPSDLSTLEGRRAALRGFATGLFDPASVLSRVDERAAALGLLWRAADVTDGPATMQMGGTLSADAQAEWSHDIDFADRRWRLELAHAAPVWTAGRSVGSRALAVANVLAALLFSFATLAQAARGASVRQEVASRTAELRHELAAREAAEAALRVSHEEIDATLRSIGDGVLTTDGAGRVTRLNGVAERLSGWREAEAMGRPVHEVLEVLFESSRQRALVPVTQAAAIGRSVNTSDRLLLVARDGSEAAVALSTALIEGAVPGGHGAVLVFRDVEAQRIQERALEASRAELAEVNANLERLVAERMEALVESEQFNRDIFEFAPDALLLINEDGVIVRCNRQTEAMFGWPAGSLVGKSVGELMPHSTLGAHRALRSLYAERSVPRPMGGGTGGLMGIRHDGTTFPADISLAPLSGSRGRLVAAAIRDATARLHAEREVADSAGRYRQTLNYMLEGAQVIDFAYRYLYVNETAARHGGLAVDVLMGRAMTELYPGIDQLPWFAKLRSCMESRTPEAWTTSFTRPDGTRGGFEVTAHPVEEGVLVLSLDVSARLQADDVRAEHEQALAAERGQLAHRVEEATAQLRAANEDLVRAREEAEQANRAKSAFLAAISHEIRTPMNGVIGMAEVLAASELSADQAEAVGTIRESATSLLRLVDDVLDFSKIEAGRFDLERTPVPVAELVEAVCASLVPLAESKGVELLVYVDPALPPKIWSDPTRLRQVLVNLLGNAIKFSGGRDVVGQVRVRLEPAAPVASDALPRLRLCVRDNGIGIEEGVQALLFEPFFQASAATARRFGGTGLGLAICRRIVATMGGEIGLNSAPGQGATFTVDLPVELVEGAAAEPLPNLEGVRCVLASDSDFPIADLVAHLRAAKAAIHVVAELASARALAATLPGAVLIEDAGRKRLHLSGLISRVQPGAPGPRVLLTASLNRRARVDGSTVVVDRSALRRRTFLLAVAVAAGRETGPELAGRGASRPALRPVSSIVRAQAGESGRPLILVAEDDEINRRVLLRQLDLLGYAADVANDGGEALRLWRTGRHALVLTDLDMPVLTGYELAQAIRAEEVAGADIPILALTANVVSGEAKRAFAAGMQEYLSKPIELAGLRAALNRWAPRAEGAWPTVAEPGGAEPDRNAAFDMAVLRRLVGPDEAVVLELLGEFVTSCTSVDDQLEAALARGELREVGSICHRLKSRARAVGALQLAEECAAVEAACATGRVGEIGAAAGSLRGVLANVVLGIATHLTEPSRTNSEEA